MESSYVRTPLLNGSLLKRSLFPLLLLLLVGLAACGGSPATAGQPPAAPAPGAKLSEKTNPCSLLTQSQVQQVLKATVGVTPPQVVNGKYVPENPCMYGDPNDPNGSSSQIFLATFPDAATARANFHKFATFNGSDFHAIANLGEQALLVAQPVPELFVQKDNGILTVGVVSGTDTSANEQQEQQLAQMAVQQM